jgi:hypothetical protein
VDDAHDDLDDRLAQSAPRDIIVTAAVEDELARMTVLSRTDGGRTSTARRHLSRAATIGISTVIVLATAGAAAAAVTFGPWFSDWADDPVATITYTLPGGDVCERRMGAIVGEDAELTAAIEGILTSPGFLDELDIDAAIRGIRADSDKTETLADGTQVDVSYGTPGYMTPDEEYEFAVTQAVLSEVMSELAEMGPGDAAPERWAGLSFEGETKCIPGEQ